MKNKKKLKTKQPAQKALVTVEERSALDIVRAINSGELDARQLSTEDRQACVEHLLSEALSIPEMAQILLRSERTIARDRKAIQLANAIEHDPQLVGVMAGRILTEADQCISRIRKVCRKNEAPHSVRVDGERACFQIVSEAVQRLQSLGYLPTAAHQLHATLSHSVSDVPKYEELTLQIKQLREIDQSCVHPFTEDLRNRLEQLDQTKDRAQLAELVGDLAEAARKEVVNVSES